VKKMKENIKKPLRVKIIFTDTFLSSISTERKILWERDDECVGKFSLRKNKIRNSRDANKQHGMKKLVKYFPLSLISTLFFLFSLALVCMHYCSFSVVFIALLFSCM
jgi:hypothetical protein